MASLLIVANVKHILFHTFKTFCLFVCFFKLNFLFLFFSYLTLNLWLITTEQYYKAFYTRSSRKNSHCYTSYGIVVGTRVRRRSILGPPCFLTELHPNSLKIAVSKKQKKNNNKNHHKKSPTTNKLLQTSHLE